MMKRPTLAGIFKGCCVLFLLLLVFVTQMFYSSGLYKIAIWLDGLYRLHMEDPLSSVTALMTPERVEKNKMRIRQNIGKDAVFIAGGEFIMGADDCNKYAPALSQCSGAPVYPVKLTSFSMLKFKITNRDFDTFQADNGAFRNPYRDAYDQQQWELIHQNGDLPAIINWTMANNYCHWVGKLTGLPVALPTEAQWEFAARNRGQHVGFMTNNNTIEPGVNVPSYEMRSSQKAGYRTPVGQFPPSPLGLYDLSGNGLEWVNDWYSPRKPAGNGVLLDPQGPAKGDLSNEGPAKVLRPYQASADSSGFGVTVHDRYFAAAAASLNSASPYSARCVINRSQRIAIHE